MMYKIIRYSKLHHVDLIYIFIVKGIPPTS